MGERVLLVNDSKFEAIVLKDILCKLKYDVECCDEFEVFENIEVFKPGFIMVNMIMKEKSGDKLVKEIKRDYKDCKFLLSSCNPIDIKDFSDMGVDAVIQTPVSIIKLEGILNSIKDEPAGKDEKQVMVSFCPYCGGKIDSKDGRDFLFCPYCGSKKI